MTTLIVLLTAILTAGLGQDTVDQVRQMVIEARKEIEAYKTAGGAAGAVEHPANKWNAALWQVHERSPQSDAGARAAVEAVRLLVGAELWDNAHARVASLDADNPAWERVPSVVYEEGIARKSFDYTIATLSRTAAATKSPSIKSAALIVIGRVHRRQGDLPAATRSLEEARAAAPGTLQAEEADGLIYEIKYLSVGLPAPAISGTPRNARGPISLESFRGKPVILVFWASYCVACMEEVPLLKALHAKYSNEAVILGISVDTSVARADGAIETKGLTWPQLADGKGFDAAAAKAYRIQGTPELFVLDREGRIFARPSSAKQIEARLQEALARPPGQ
jgi:peroxiredoxin